MRCQASRWQNAYAKSETIHRQISRGYGSPRRWSKATLCDRHQLTLRFVFRLVIEHMAHAGTENGNLICTFKDCKAWGIRSDSIAETQADAIRRGLVYRTQRGIASTGDGRKPSRFGLGWLPGHDGSAAPNLWKRYRRSPDPTQEIKSTPNGGIKLKGGFQPKAKPGSRIKYATGGAGTIPTGGAGKKANGGGIDNHDALPPGWKWGKDTDNHVRALCPGPPNRPWIGAPIIDGVGDELEQQARAKLKAWKGKRE
jgi:hypothetical protein